MIGLYCDREYRSYADNSASPYTDIIDSALKCLDKCIAICESKTFTLPATWIPGMTYTNVQIGQLANSMAARFLSYSPEK